MLFGWLAVIDLFLKWVVCCRQHSTESNLKMSIYIDSVPVTLQSDRDIFVLYNILFRMLSLLYDEYFKLLFLSCRNGKQNTQYNSQQSCT